MANELAHMALFLYNYDKSIKFLHNKFQGELQPIITLLLR